MDYVRDRLGNEQPTLKQMSLKALELLNARNTGLFIMIEGARIDMASHGNDLPRTIDETLAFDDAVRAVATWAEGHDNVTLLVTADHECGGLELIEDAPAEQLPTVHWRWGQHTNARVDIFGLGSRSAVFDGEVRNHRWVHADLLAAVTNTEIARPTKQIVADGNLRDLRYLVAEQETVSGFGEGYNELNSMRVDADAEGLTVGLSGLVEADANALVLFIDTDMGTGAGLSSDLSDTDGQVDSLLSSLPMTPTTAAGFAPEFVVVTIGAMAPHKEELLDLAGMRGLIAPYGSPDDLGWFGVSMNFGNHVRTANLPQQADSQEGYEVTLPWSELYPEYGGTIPMGARVGLAAILVNTSGSFLSNQALPTFPVGTENPGAAMTTWPGAVDIFLDHNNDGHVDVNLSGLSEN